MSTNSYSYLISLNCSPIQAFKRSHYLIIINIEYYDSEQHHKFAVLLYEGWRWHMPHREDFTLSGTRALHRSQVYQPLRIHTCHLLCTYDGHSQWQLNLAQAGWLFVYYSDLYSSHYEPWRNHARRRVQDQWWNCIRSHRSLLQFRLKNLLSRRKESWKSFSLRSRVYIYLRWLWLVHRLHCVPFGRCDKWWSLLRYFLSNNQKQDHYHSWNRANDKP